MRTVLVRKERQTDAAADIRVCETAVRDSQFEPG
jgi:hypothetical protein